MNPFLQGQMDYIFFFYGLAFIGLGVVCSILSKEVNPRLPWGWLALFGSPTGPTWLDLVALSWPGVMWFGALRWAIMTASFLCLVEFARLTLTQRRGRGPGAGSWSFCAWAPAWGIIRLDRLKRHHPLFPGPGGQPRGRVGALAEAREAEPRCRPWLLAGGVGFIFYGLAAGLVVPQAGFLPAAAVNYETFTSLTGLPIQLVQGLLALWIVVHDHGLFPGGLARRI